MEYTWNLILLLVICGIIFGALTTMAGSGGGVFYVSFMVLILNIPFDEARDTSIFIMVIASGTAFISYLRQNRTDIKLSLFFSMFAILGSILCWIFLFFFPISNELLRIIFGFVLLITAANMIFKTYMDKKNGCNSGGLNCDFNLQDFNYKKNLKSGIPFFIAAGVASRLLGIGGGIINCPSLHIVFGYPIHNATAISNSIVFFNAVFNTILLIQYGKINYLVGIYLAIGSVIGAIIGAKLSDKMPKLQLQIFVSVFLVFIGINILFPII
jgi:hypothetical protein